MEQSSQKSGTAIGEIATPRDSISDYPESMREFAELLEKRMIAGHSREMNRAWAVNVMGCTPQVFERIRALITISWREDGRTLEEINAMRDEARQRALLAYREAHEKGRIDLMLRANEQIIDLDGLSKTEQTSLVAVGLPGHGGTTNAARNSVAQLIEKAKALAGAKAGEQSPVIDAVSTEKDPTNRLQLERKSGGHSNGTNGHSKNGFAVTPQSASVDPDDDPDDGSKS